MMKIRYISPLFIFGTVFLTSLVSCGEDRWPEYYPETGRDLWMDSLMRQEYLWYKDMPSIAPGEYFLEPDAFLEKVRSPKDKGFSTIDTLDNEPVLTYGFDYMLYKVLANDTAYNALVTYVIPGSPAAGAGLERGHWIMMVDNDYITRRNEEVLTEGEARTLTIGRYAIVQDEEGEEIGVIRSLGDVTVPAARTVTDNPVHKAEVFRIEGTDKTVGYLMYNHFTAGPVAGSEAYNDELRAFSQRCKQSGVNEFVLDLRYNTGGAMECAQLLCTMLTPEAQMNNALAILRYNDKQVGKNRELALDPALLQGGANLNLSRVYILATGETAAASEMVINCLKPYMEVVLIGATTKGENVATETFTSPQFRWVFRPVVCEVFNSKGESDYTSGFAPAYAVNETAELQWFLPFGNPEEALLNVALNLIVGNAPATRTMTRAARPMEAVKSVTVCRKGHRGLMI